MLGFDLVHKAEQLGWCQMGTPYEGVNVGLGQAEEPKPGGATPTFSVDDGNAFMLAENLVREAA